MNNVVLEEYKGVYVFAQQVDNEISGIAFELLGKVRSWLQSWEQRLWQCSLDIR